jgi:hypothetical protein
VAALVLGGLASPWVALAVGLATVVDLARGLRRTGSAVRFVVEEGAR